MSLKEQLVEKKSALKALEDRIKAGEEEAITEGEEIAQAIKELEASIEAAQRASELLAQIGPEETEEEEETMEASKARTLGDHFVNYVKSAQHSNRFDISAPAFKAATDTQTSPAGAVDFATTFDKNVVTAARTPLVIRDLFGAETISGSTLVYLVEGAIQGAPAVTAEGAEKPQVHFADPTPKTVSLAKIACHIKESDEYINDFPFLASAINGRLLYELGLVEQNKLVTDLLGTSGIQSDTTSWTAGSDATAIADLILDAAMDVQQGSGFAADAVVINPGYMLGPMDVKPSSGRMLLMGYRKSLVFAPTGGKAFVDVRDVAVAVVNALMLGENGRRYIAVNRRGCHTIKELYQMQAQVMGYRQRVVTVPDWLMYMAGFVGDILRGLGVRTELSSCNVRQLMVREYYDSSLAVKELQMPETDIALSIRDFHGWRLEKEKYKP